MFICGSFFVRFFFLGFGKGKQDVKDAVLVDTLYLQGSAVGENYGLVVLRQTVQLTDDDTADGVVIIGI